MRILQCDTCKGPAKLSDGKDYTIGSLSPHKWPFRVYCAQCKRVTYVTATQYNQLPRVSPPTSPASEPNSSDDTTT